MQETNKRLFIPYHSIGLFDRAESAAKESQGVVCVILAVAAVEAFTHDLTEWYSLCESSFKNPSDDNGLPKNHFTIRGAIEFSKLNELERNICEKLKEAEQNRKNVCEKLSVIFELKGEKLNKGTNPYQDFSQVVQIRNEIIHVKGETLTIDKQSISGYPRFITRLSDKKLITLPSSPEDFYKSSWLNIIETKEFSNWCTSSVKNMVNKTLDLLPPTQSSTLFINQVRF